MLVFVRENKSGWLNEEQFLKKKTGIVVSRVICLWIMYNEMKCTCTNTSELIHLLLQSSFFGFGKRWEINVV